MVCNKNSATKRKKEEGKNKILLITTLTRKSHNSTTQEYITERTGRTTFMTFTKSNH